MHVDQLSQEQIDLEKSEHQHSPADQAAGSNLRCADDFTSTKTKTPKSVTALLNDMVTYRKLAVDNFILCYEYCNKYIVDDTPLFPDLKAASDHFLAYHKHAREFVYAASKLISYQSPKLSQVDINRNVTKRYVISVPGVRARNNDEWLARIEYDKRKLDYDKRNRNIVLSDIQDSIKDSVDQANIHTDMGLRTQPVETIDYEVVGR